MGGSKAAASTGEDGSFVWKERYLAIFTRMLQLEFKVRNSRMSLARIGEFRLEAWVLLVNCCARNPSYHAARLSGLHTMLFLIAAVRRRNCL